MHLMCFVKMKKPGLFFRSMVILAQGVLVNLYFLCYLISPSFCHRFVGYLEEEAVHTYTHLLKDLDAGKLQDLAAMEVPEIAKGSYVVP